MELRFSDRHIVALNVLLVTILAYFAALALNDVMMLRHASVELPAIHVRGSNSDDGAAKPRAAYQQIVERDIFNLEPPPSAPPPVVHEDLHLTLVGVSQLTQGKPYAIVADMQGEQSVYRVGEVIPGAGKLLEVGKDQATVLHDGKQVVLEIPKEDLDDGSGAGSGPSPAIASFQDQLRHHRRRRSE
jgi:type II secretory pathway component PulC